MSETVLYVSKIKSGTVIDHISYGHALDVVKILGLTGREKKTITIAINVPSKAFKRKDIVKIESKELTLHETQKIALLAPNATINIIRNYKVVEKQNVKLPKIIENIIKCPNPICISNSKEPVQAKFNVEIEDPVFLKCYYCNSILEKKDILQQF